MTTGPDPASAGVNIRKIVPDLAVQFGYNLYLADCCQTPALKASAQRTIDDFSALLDSYSAQGPERVYCTAVRMAANSLARGIARGKQMFGEQIDAARQHKARMVSRIVQSEKLRGFLQAGVRMLLLGGFGYAAVRAVLELPKFQGRMEGMNENFVSVATALGVALIGSWVRSLLTTQRIITTFRQYDEALTRAKKEYSDNIVREYRFAAEVAEQAWKQLTGEDPPMTNGFRNLLIGIMGGDEAIEESPLEPTIRGRMVHIVTRAMTTLLGVRKREEKAATGP